MSKQKAKIVLHIEFAIAILNKLPSNIQIMKHFKLEILYHK